MTLASGIVWHQLADTFSDPAPGLAQAWTTYVGVDKEGVFHARMEAPDGDDSFDIGTASDLIERVKEQHIELEDLAAIAEYEEGFERVWELLAPLFDEDDYKKLGGAGWMATSEDCG